MRDPADRDLQRSCCREVGSGSVAVPGSWCDLAEAVCVSLDFIPADATSKRLPFEIAAPRRMWRPPRQAHAIPALRANGIIGRAEANLHGAILGVEIKPTCRAG